MFDQNYLKSLCKKYGLTPSKKYGQNFLINPELIEKMLETAQIKADDTIVEIGPGFGVLTLALSEKAKKVIAFEIEKKLTPYWEEIQKTHPNIEIIWGNVLKTPVFPTEPYKVVANIPYQITSNLIRTLLTSQNQPQSTTLMVQKEVAERICAKPGDMSVLSVSVQFFAQPEIITNVPRAYFWPEPAVDSAVIKIEPNPTQLKNQTETEFFFKIVKTGFANKRKILIKNLEHLINKKNRSKLQEIFTKLGLNNKVRAQELSVQNWIDLARKLSTY